MTDRHTAYIVVLEKAIREDDAHESIIPALRMLRGVLSVKPVEAGEIDVLVAMERVRSELGRKLWEVLYPENKQQ